MHQLRNYGDARQSAGCALCGKETGTRDHVPPRVFLDEPFPENLPIVDACEACNNGASSDEEYAACFIDCARTGTEKSHPTRRPKIERVLRRQPSLQARIAASASIIDGAVVWKAEADRMHRVVLKMARGLATYELNEPRLEVPDSVVVVPLVAVSAVQREAFERVPTVEIFPEVGSRAMQRLVETDNPAGWMIVQPGRFRYALIWEGSATVVRMVFSEYFAAEIIWR